MSLTMSAARGLNTYSAIAKQAGRTEASQASKYDPVQGLLGAAVDTSELRSPNEAMLQEALITSVSKEVQGVADSAGISLEGLSAQAFSPEAVSERIFEFTTGLLPAFRRQNPDLSEMELIESFETTIRDAVDSGFKDARSMVSAVETTEADVAVDIADRTHSMLKERFDTYFADLHRLVEDLAAEEMNVAQVEVQEIGPLHASRLVADDIEIIAPVAPATVGSTAVAASAEFVSGSLDIEA